MVPQALNPLEWLAVVDGLPRIPAVALLVVAVSMLAFGLRAFRYYIRLGCAVAAWVGGTMLGNLMLVTTWYVALPATVLAVVLVCRIAPLIAPLTIGWVAACAVGTLVVKGFAVHTFWLAFAAGLVAGVTLAVLAPRFTTALFSAASAALAIISSLGVAVAAPNGWLAPGGYRDYPVLFVIAGAVLFVASMITQVAIEPESALDGH